MITPIHIEHPLDLIPIRWFGSGLRDVNGVYRLDEFYIGDFGHFKFSDDFLRDGFIVFLLSLFKFAFFVEEAVFAESLFLGFNPGEFILLQGFGKVGRRFSEDDDVRVVDQPSTGQPKLRVKGGGSTF